MGYTSDQIYLDEGLIPPKVGENIYTTALNFVRDGRMALGVELLVMENKLQRPDAVLVCTAYALGLKHGREEKNG